MLQSIEVRWFMAGHLPPEARRWFQAAAGEPNLVKSELLRIDRYLVLPGVAFLGIKLREGRFEVKRRDADLGLATLGSRACGRVAFWRKWSFTITGQDDAIRSDRDWIEVEKERHLRKYEIEKAQTLKAVDPNERPKCGCTVELTNLKIQGAKWWSFGFEAFDTEEARLRETLQLAATACLNSDDYPALPSGSSFDYPEWLGRLSPLPGLSPNAS